MPIAIIDEDKFSENRTADYVEYPTLSKSDGLKFVEDRLATIHVVQRGSTGVDESLAGYLRAWLWVTENPYGNCRGFLLTMDAFWLHPMSHSICIAGGLQNMAVLR